MVYSIAYTKNYTVVLNGTGTRRAPRACTCHGVWCMGCNAKVIMVPTVEVKGIGYCRCFIGYNPVRLSMSSRLRWRLQLWHRSCLGT